MNAFREPDLRGIIERLREKARRKVPETDVEDLVQEVLVVLVERMQRSGVETLQAYAEGILRHKIYDYYQSKKERHISLDKGMDTETNGPSPEQRVVFMRHLRVIEGLAKENDVDQALVEEHFVRGAPLREVADQLKVSPGVVNGRLFRFRQKITQRIGSCFAFVVALFMGLGSRVSRALMAVRMYGSVVGMLSVGSFASWMWWGKTAPPKQEQTYQAPSPRPSRVVAPPVVKPRPKAASTTVEDRVFDPQIRETQPAPIMRLAAPVWEPQEQPKPVFERPTPKTIEPVVPEPKSVPKKPRWMVGFLPISSVQMQKYVQRQRAQRVLRKMRNSTNRVPTQQSNTSGSQTGRQGTTKKPTNSNPNPRTTPKPPLHRPQPRNPTGPTTSRGNPRVPNGSGIKDITRPGMLQPNMGGQSRLLPGSEAYATDKTWFQPGSKADVLKRSFCVRQDGHIYTCGGDKMNDITGLQDSTFGCGTNKLCTDMIGKGPSLLFGQNGELYILGDKRYRMSQNGGKSWTSPSKTQSPDVLMKKAMLILNQDGTIWSQKQGQWQKVRKHQVEIQEVRVHLTQGHVKFEDDTGFKLNTNWKTHLERTQKTLHSPLVSPGDRYNKIQHAGTENTLQPKLNHTPKEAPTPVTENTNISTTPLP